MVDAEMAASLRRIGAPAMDPDEAAAMLGPVLSGEIKHPVVAEFDWPTFEPAFTLVRRRPLLNELIVGKPEKVAGQTSYALADEVYALRQEERLPKLQEFVRTQVAELLGYAPQDVSATRSFADLGIDSVSAVTLRNVLEKATGLDLPTSLAFDVPTVAAMAQYLLDGLTGRTESAPSVEDLVQNLESAVLEMPNGTILPGLAAKLLDLANRVDTSGASLGEPDNEPLADLGSLRDASAEDVLAFIDTEMGVE